MSSILTSRTRERTLSPLDLSPPPPLTTPLRSKTNDLETTLESSSKVYTFFSIPYLGTETDKKMDKVVQVENTGNKDWDATLAKIIYNAHGKHIRCISCRSKDTNRLDGQVEGKVRIKCKICHTSKYLFDEKYVHELEYQFYKLLALPGVDQYKRYYSNKKQDITAIREIPPMEMPVQDYDTGKNPTRANVKNYEQRLEECREDEGTTAILKIMEHVENWKAANIEVPKSTKTHIAALASDICCVGDEKMRSRMLSNLIGVLESTSTILLNTLQGKEKTKHVPTSVNPNDESYASKVRNHPPNTNEKGNQQARTRPEIDAAAAERMAAGMRARPNDLTVLYIKGLSNHRYFEIRQFFKYNNIDIRCIPEMAWATEGILEIYVWSTNVAEVKIKLHGKGNGNIKVSEDIADFVLRPTEEEYYLTGILKRLETRLPALLPQVRGVRFMKKQRILELKSRLEELAELNRSRPQKTPQHTTEGRDRSSLPSQY
jgi:hypothetical protein